METLVSMLRITCGMKYIIERTEEVGLLVGGGAEESVGLGVLGGFGGLASFLAVFLAVSFPLSLRRTKGSLQSHWLTSVLEQDAPTVPSEQTPFNSSGAW